MKRIAYTIDLQDDPALIEEYLEYHRNVWPEVQDGLKSVGLVEMNIYRTARVSEDAPQVPAVGRHDG